MESGGTGSRGSGPTGALGVTLIELMITALVLAILLSVAIPSYREYVRRGAVAGAIEVLAGGRVVAEQFFLDNREYEGMPCPAGTRHFTIECESDEDGYTITAVGNGSMDEFVYTINEANLRTTRGPWGDANCWITRKGEGC
jgi:type IV pilus assembly protein PilE